MSLIIYSTSMIFTVLIVSYWSRRIRPNSCDFFIKRDQRQLLINKKCFLLILAFVPMWILLVFRDKSVGVDTGGTYYYIYRNILFHEYAHSTRIQVEQGYLLLNRFILFFTDSYNIILIVTGTLSWFLFYRYFIKKSSDPGLSIFFFFMNFFYFHQFNVIRQLLACAIALQGFKYIYDRKIFKFVFVILIAALFHKMVLVLVPFYFLYDIKIDIKKSFSILVISKIAFGVVWAQIVLLLVNTKYFDVISWSGAYAGGYMVGELLTTAVLFCIGLYLYLKDSNNKLLNFNLWLQLVALVIEINSNMIPVAYRFLWFANINTPLFIPLMLDSVSSKKNRTIIKIGIILIFCVYFAQKWINGDDGIQNFLFWKG